MLIGNVFRHWKSSARRCLNEFLKRRLRPSFQKRFCFFQKHKNILFHELNSCIFHFQWMNAEICRWKKSAANCKITEDRSEISDFTVSSRRRRGSSEFLTIFTPTTTTTPTPPSTHELLLQEVGGAFGSSLTFLWTKYIKSLLLRRLKSCNNGRWQGQKGPKYMLHQPKAVCTRRRFHLTVHVGCWLRFFWASRQGNKMGQCRVRPSSLSWRIYGDLRVSVGRRCAHNCVSSRHHRNQLCTPIIHPRRAVSAAPLSYYRQRVQMVKSRCSAEKKKEKMKRGKKEEAPGLPVVAVWGCSHYD